jgi:metallo-beta-lactamase family protein
MFRRKVVPKFPIYLDTPMGIDATKIYWEHLQHFDEEFQALRMEKPLTEDLTTLIATPTAEDSKALNDKPGPCLILAGSGMCTGGRILHHLRHNLGKPEAAVLIVGYQSEGSLGRRLVDHDREIGMFGERITVRARVHTLGGFSAHAGQTDLLHWFTPMADDRPRLFLTHGESRGREPFAKLIRQKFSIEAELPSLGQTVIL